MVFIHGGGFFAGGGDIAMNPPGFLLDHDVILVVGNYRLGPFGFLSMENSDLPGNNGLRDQLLLLEWIQENAAVFGGDRHLITLFGNSAGSASVAFHMMNPTSSKLFQRAIMQSGNPLCLWSMDHLGMNARNTLELGESLGCFMTNNDTTEFVKCLKSRDAKEMVNKIMEIFPHLDTPFLPNVEEGRKAFITGVLPTTPINIPLLIGVTSDEGAANTASTLRLIYNHNSPSK